MIDGDLDEFLPPPDAAKVAWCQFDAQWYLQAYPEVADELPDPTFELVRAHYLSQGRQRGYGPNMYFDEIWYIRRYPDVAEAIATGIFASGYLHYCGSGYLDRSPHWLYDEATYAEATTELDGGGLAESGCVNRYDHYLVSGARAGRIAHLLFDPATYRAGLSGGELAGFEALGGFAHFLSRVWRRRDAVTSVYFDPAWYLDRHAEAREAIASGVFVCALQAYLVGTAPTDPCEAFDEAWYLAAHPDVAAEVAEGQILSGYEHFLRRGVFARDAPRADLDMVAYAASQPEAVAAVAAGEARDLFEYLLRNGDIAAAARPAPPAVRQAARPAPRRASETARGGGHVDFHGYHTPSRGWIFCGWVTTDLATLDAGAAVTAYFEHGQFSGDALLASHRRDDLGGIGVGVVIHLPGNGAPLGGLISLGVAIPGASWTITPSDRAPVLRDQALSNAVLPVIGALVAGATRSRLSTLAARRGYTGENTLGALQDRIFLEIDEAIFCPPDGLALVGWSLFDPSLFRSVRVQSGHLSAELNLAQAVRIDRHDVLESVGIPNGLPELRSGFIAYVPNAVQPGEDIHIEIETARGEVAHRGVPRPRLRGMAAIRFLLDHVDLRYAEVAPAFDHVFGPAVTALNIERLASPTPYEVVDFGPQPQAPVLSVIVALYGRLDFMEYQFAFLSRAVPEIAVEYLYVLDEPARKREAESLAASIYQRFRIPLRLVCLGRNVGFGPANNVGLGLAAGEFVCFLNSDVFAGSPDWMQAMVARLRADAWLGTVGPLLIYEDDCVQHQGMAFERLDEFAGWQFPLHPRKGWHRPPATGLEPSLAITGACMVMRTDLARQLGGFDEAFVIGDFEDSDLCLKLRRRGLGCAVDTDKFLYHLERQSQAGSQHRWRMNLTLCNAWTHERRWGDMLARLDQPAGAHPAGAMT